MKGFMVLGPWPWTSGDTVASIQSIKTRTGKTKPETPCPLWSRAVLLELDVCCFFPSSEDSLRSWVAGLCLTDGGWSSTNGGWLADFTWLSTDTGHRLAGNRRRFLTSCTGQSCFFFGAKDSPALGSALDPQRFFDRFTDGPVAEPTVVGCRLRRFPSHRQPCQRASPVPPRAHSEPGLRTKWKSVAAQR